MGFVLNELRTRRVEMLTFEGDNPDWWIFQAKGYFVLNKMSESEKLEVVVVSFVKH